jgi:hypothetical protein
MRSPPPPIRFLLGVVCGWAGIRIAMLAPGGDGPPAGDPPVARAGTAAGLDMPTRAAAMFVKLRHSRSPPTAAGRAPAVPERLEAGTAGRVATFVSPVPLHAPRVPTSLATSATLAPAAIMPEPPSSGPIVPTAAAIPPADGRSRWSASAWLFARRGLGAPELAPAGTLGGSQAGARLTYRLGRPAAGLSLSLRLYAPLSDRHAAEAALGLDWKPRALPMHLLVERWTKLGRDGRSAFGLTAYGGVDDVALGPLRLGVYGQAGAVGASRRDLFADGAARLTMPLGRLRVGAGAWAAAQPGVSRVDAGPHADLTLPVVGASITLSADWRFRLAGAARPGSGPAITISTGF